MSTSGKAVRQGPSRSRSMWLQGIALALRQLGQRLIKRSKPYLVPLLILDVAVVYLFATHVMLTDEAANVVKSLGHLHPRDPGASLLEHNAQDLLHKSLIALLLAGCGTLVSLTLLAAIAWSVRCLRKSRRFAVALGGYLNPSSEKAKLKVVDISVSGCRVSLDSPVPLGATVRLSAGGTDFPPARVIWSKEGSAGLQFTEPFDERRLEMLTRGNFLKKPLYFVD